MTARWITCVSIAMGLALAASARADDKALDGTWKSVYKAPDGAERTTTFHFKVDGEKVTGTVVGRNNNESTIENGTLKDGILTFTITREMNNNKVTITYSGKFNGEMIKGTSERPAHDDVPVSRREWIAKRDN